MKYIEVDEELYRYIAGKTERIGESASDILRRLLGLSVAEVSEVAPVDISEPGMEHEPVQVREAEPEPVPEVEVAAQTEIDFSDLLSEAGLAAQKGAVGRFLYALECLHQAAPSRFEQVLQIQGRDRLYFATSKEALLKASQSANPKEIGSSGFWVTTNNNTAKKRTILEEALVQLGCDPVRAKSLGELALA
ncbi:replication initiation negative regulator SeqA [Shewanella amazonensis]|uniref:Negative modulator of initiation of replication n=1 Tax=Shewanella amazonensis (strain ATCC BAA-1098 / SB2B) TaxID=326297 RepID=SEQA_SHEAM|nr:replication initiation negative regulator SeqA [Shewanella amazonensis]A1S6A5.1 RecName: Full=Negative modulator of initiation of replication [Shewanella amazonensis SB2B]ABL99911.1 seqA protein [Shewanella amazonensis SB2B]